MLPFIVALVFAVGLPLLHSSFHKALHLPALNFNFLLPRPAPEQILISSQETMLLLESSYPDVNPDSGGSPLYLVLPDLASADCSNQAAAEPTCMSLTEKQDYPQPSIWNVIHTQLLYQLAEATIIIALSFFVTATLLSRCGLSTVMERLCTALLISRSYTPKAALSSFLQDVFHGLHKYWMNDSVCKGDTPDSTANNSRQTALEVFTHMGGESCEQAERGASVSSSTSVSNLRDNLSFIPDNSSLCSGSSLSASMRLPHSVKFSPATNPASTSPPKIPARPLCSNTNISEQERLLGTAVKRYPPLISQPTTISETTKHDFDMTKNETSRVNQICTAETPGPTGDNCSPVVSSTMSLQPISIEDLYKSSRVSTTPITLPDSEPHRAQEASVSDPSPFSHPSCDRESLSNVNVTTPNLKFERFPSGNNSASSLEISKGSRRRYKSDVTCASWKGALQGSERRVETLVKEPLPPASLPRSLRSPRIRRNRSEQGGNGPSVADAALAGFVVTVEGSMVVPASQRPDGSMRKEIRLRTGHSLRESFTEKYLPPAARRRTSTWSPLLCENSASTPTSPHRGDSPLPSTPSSCQRPFMRHSNSPACLSDNWRLPSSGTTAGRTQPAIATILPSMKGTEPSLVAIDTDEGNSAQATSLKQCSVPSAITSTSPTITVPEIDQHAPVPAASRPPSPTTLDPSAVKETVPINEGTEARNPIDATDDGDDDDDRASLENQQPDVPSSTHSTSKTAPGKEGRRPLQDITFTFTVPGLKPIEYQTHSTISDILPKDLLKTPTRIKINEDLSRAMREAALNSPRKRKPSPEPKLNEPMFRAGDDPLTPPRLPRGRHSAPHLGKYVTKRQAKAPRASQTPESSKRRRMRTASSRDVENWTIALAPPATTDHGGQMIVLPAGTGWKGRSSTVVPPTPQCQRQPTGTIA